MPHPCLSQGTDDLTHVDNVQWFSIYLKNLPRSISLEFPSLKTLSKGIVLTNNGIKALSFPVLESIGELSFANNYKLQTLDIAQEAVVSGPLRIVNANLNTCNFGSLDTSIKYSGCTRVI